MKQQILKKLELATTKALVMECTVPKPGNVSRYHDFPSQKFEHFLVSGIELGANLPHLASKHGLGTAVLKATEIMLSVQSGGNTHLGSIFLLTPLLASASANRGIVDFADVQDRIKRADWRDTLRYVQAIRMTDFEKLPDIEGCLNVKSEGTLNFVKKNRTSLHNWMLAGVAVNGICYEYTHGYKLTRNTAKEIMENWDAGIERAVQHGFLFALGSYVDNLVVGKKGLGYARRLQNLAAELHAERTVFAAEGSDGWKRFRQLFTKLEKDRVNPGTTADIIVGAMFLIFLEGFRV
ncbi:MAG: triphosphoribosyl-dephospho-CoA synthase [Thermoplasmata archaeon]|nr:triphosphoribosyl-dephospho-CoA synthase [Thermoplasmata archaeon]